MRNRYFAGGFLAVLMGVAPQVGLTTGEFRDRFEDSYSGPTPIHPKRWVDADDYPLDEFRSGAQGTVVFQLSVDPTGKTYRCEVLFSSGWPGLDDVTCLTKLKRARFNPARDENGNPVYGAFGASQAWINPNSWAKRPSNTSESNSLIFFEGLGKGVEKQPVGLVLLVDPDGNVAKCRARTDAAPKPVIDAGCDYMVRTGVPPLLDEAGSNTRGVMNWSVAFTGDPPSTRQKGKVYQAEGSPRSGSEAP